MGARVGVMALFAVMTLIFVLIGGAAGYFFYGDALAGAVFFVIISAIFNISAYFLSDRLVMKANKAHVVTEAQEPVLHRIVSEVATSFGMQKPTVAVSDFPTPNAFATGRSRKRAVVCATRGILQLLNEKELKGVIAHEMAHIKDRDVLVMTLAATIAGAISWAANSILFASMFGMGGRRGGDAGIVGLLLIAITVPIAAMLLQLSISRSREAEADIVGAKTIGDPLSLISALEKLQSYNERRPIPVSPATSSLYIVNPGRKGNLLVRLMSTHPPIELRIKRLQRLAMEMGYWAGNGSETVRRKRSWT